MDKRANAPEWAILRALAAAPHVACDQLEALAPPSGGNALERLRQDGWIASEWGEGRISAEGRFLRPELFRLTEAARVALGLSPDMKEG